MLYVFCDLRNFPPPFQDVYDYKEKMKLLDMHKKKKQLQLLQLPFLNSFQ